MRRLWIVVGIAGCVGGTDPCANGIPVQTIDGVLDHIDALPEPTLECLLAALERPIGLELTSDVFSTQPAQGVRSPRIFLRTEALTLTVVPVGEARNLLEFGEAHDDSGFTVKAELAFPLAQPFDPEVAYEQALESPGADATGCRVCHVNELEVAPGRFASNAIRPPDEMVVPIDALREEHEGCDWDEDPVRCGMFSAVLDHGEVTHAPFARSVTTQFIP